MNLTAQNGRTSLTPVDYSFVIDHSENDDDVDDNDFDVADDDDDYDDKDD